MAFTSFSELLFAGTDRVNFLNVTIDAALWCVHFNFWLRKVPINSLIAIGRDCLVKLKLFLILAVESTGAISTV